MEATATTTSGKVRGAVENGVAVFRGVPFAAAPVGDLRFRPPAPPAPWDGERDVTRFGPTVRQAESPGIFQELFAPTHPAGDDCLNLNVWTPDPGGSGLPVFVWIHGGAFVIGAGSDSVYDGAPFARDGVVAVTVNYRLGAEGFLHVEEGAPGSGAFGILDQIAALEWVQANIAAFGGDRGNVTIAGESAGGMSVGTLLGAPGARGLFRRAIPQSGAGHNGIGVDFAGRISANFFERLGLKPGDRAGLTELPVERILQAQKDISDDLQKTRDPQRYGEAAASGMPFQPMLGGDVLPQRPIDAIAAGSARDVDVLIGHTAEEFMLFVGLAPELLGINEAMVEMAAGAIFGAVGKSGTEVIEAYKRSRPGASALEVFAALETDRVFRIPAIRLAEAQVAHNPNVHMYRLSWKSNAFEGRIGAGHALDIPFVFDKLEDPMGLRLTGQGAPTELAAAMHGAWVSFCATGDPAYPKLPEWPTYDTTRRATMDFNVDSSVVDDPNPEERALWEGVL